MLTISLDEYQEQDSSTEMLETFNDTSSISSSGACNSLTNSFLPEEIDAPEEVDRLNNDCNSVVDSTKIGRLLKRSSKGKD